MAQVRTEEYVIRLTWVEKKNSPVDPDLKIDQGTLGALEESVNDLIKEQHPHIVVEVLEPGADE